MTTSAYPDPVRTAKVLSTSPTSMPSARASSTDV
jgi:hypothetical protein